LLLSVPANKVDAMLARAAQVDQPLWVIGEVVDGSGIKVVE
jgi:hypothetical protein